MSQLVINILDKALKSKGYKLKKTSEYMWWSPFVSHHKPKLQKLRHKQKPQNRNDKSMITNHNYEHKI